MQYKIPLYGNFEPKYSDCNTIFVLKEDLELRDFNFSNFEEFNSLRDIARDRTRWLSLF